MAVTQFGLSGACPLARARPAYGAASGLQAGGGSGLDEMEICWSVPSGE